MNPRTRKSEIRVRSFLLFLFLGSACVLAPVRPAYSLPISTNVNGDVPCAILENFGGDVEILDPSRSRVIGITKNTGIPCGGWVSSSAGWAIIHHRDGHDLRIGANTFLEIPESYPGSKDPIFADQVVLYRGEMFGSTDGGAGELRIVTANARVCVGRGTALINFSPDDQDTQLVALEGPATLENRFEPSKKVIVKAGEATDLNFKLQRIIPTYPKAVSIASLRGKLNQFKVPGQEQSQIYETAEARAERRLAADLTAPEGEGKAVEHDDEKVVSDRKIASMNGNGSSKAVRRYSYSRNPVDFEQSQKLKARWVRKLTAGEDIGEKILHPDRFYGKPQKVKILISDPGEQMDAQKRKAEDAEKRRLIQELSGLRDQ